MKEHKDGKDYSKDFASELDEQRKNIKRPVILVSGYTGCGKTSLIRGICGKEIVDEANIKHGKPGTMEFDYYESDVVRFWDSRGFEPGENEEDYVEFAHEHVNKQQAKTNVDDHIHLVWYAIQGSGARVTSFDKRLIKSLFPNVIVAITKNDITKDSQLEDMKKELVEGGVAPQNIVACSDEDITSLQKLVELSHQKLPEAYRDAFVSAQMIDLEKKKTRAQVIIQSSTAAALAAGAVPIPFSAAAILVPIQLGMIAGLALLYGEEKEAVKMSIAPMLARAMGIFAATSLSKLIPGLGSVIEAAVAGALTQAMGQMVKGHLAERAKARIEGKEVPDLGFSLEMFEDYFRKAKENQ